MKKSNVALFSVLILCSAFLLWLWYYLGFNKVDNPFDLVLSICWWVLSALLIFGIYKLEQKRRLQIRTIYVSPDALFNSERGLVECTDPERRVALMQDMLANLKYNFNKEDMPEDDTFDFKYVVRTEDFDEKDSNEQDTADTSKLAQAADSEDEDKEVQWKGTVVRIDRTQGNQESPFDDRQALAAALA